MGETRPRWVWMGIELISAHHLLGISVLSWQFRHFSICFYPYVFTLYMHCIAKLLGCF